MSHPESPSPAALARRMQPLRDGEGAAALRRAAQGVPVHLVGGAVRDALLGRPARDLDAVVERGGAAIAARLAAILRARAVALGGDAFAAWRVARRDLAVDLWDRQGAPLAAELSRRDLTVNAVAVDLETGEIVDSCGGVEDLARRRLRAPRSTAFAEDPLRVVRLARLAAELPDFEIQRETLAAARLTAPRLLEVAPERVRLELELALGAPESERLLEALVEVGLYPGLWLGQPGAALGGAVASSRFAALATARRWLAGELPEAAAGIDHVALHGAVLTLDPAIGDAATALAQLARSGWLTRRRVAAISLLLPWAVPPASVRERRWMLHRTGSLWPTALLVAGSQQRANAGWRRAAVEVARLAGRHGAEIFAPPPLLDGHELARLTGLAAGPDLGRWVRRLRRLQIEGTLTDAAAARRWLARELPRRPPPWQPGDEP